MKGAFNVKIVSSKRSYTDVRVCISVLSQFGGIFGCNSQILFLSYSRSAFLLSA